MATVYFGNLRKAVSLPAPQTGMEATAFGRIEKIDLANGGSFVSQSQATHQEYEMSWGVTDAALLNPLYEFRRGVHGSGLLYYCDPYLDNVLPPHWATPSLSGLGWPSIYRAGIEPVVGMTGLNPVSATYTMSAPMTTQLPPRASVHLVPPTKTLWAGFTGSATNGAGVYALTIGLDGSIGTPAPLTLLSAAGSTRLNVSYSGASVSAVMFFLDTETEGVSTVTLNHAKAVYANTGTPPTLTGVAIPGEGHTGLRFQSDPVKTQVMQRNGKNFITAAVSLTEVGAWL